MSEVQQLRDMLKLQLTPADEGTIADQEEEMCHLKEENKRDMQQLLESKEEILPRHQEWNLSVKQEEIKKEENLEEADLTKFGFTAVPVKTENNGDEDEKSSQLQQSQSDVSTEVEPVASSSSVHTILTTEAEGEDYGRPQPASNSGPNRHLQPDTNGRTDSSETDNSYDWKQTRELQSGFNCQKNTNIFSSSNYNRAEQQTSCSKYGKACGHVINSEKEMGRQSSVKPFSCPNRGKGHKQKDTQNTHMRIQIEQKRFGCSACGQRFKRKSILNKHKIIHTAEKPFGCSECGQRFGRKSSLNTHMIIHTGQKPFCCSECGQRFGQKRNLSTHMIIHTGQKPFACSECGQSFRQKRNLNTHMIYHTGQKPFGCSECGKTFGQKSSLKIHMIIHTRQKPFGCSECGQRFRQKSHLNTHMIIHTGHKPFGCSECGQRFGLKNSLKTHMINHTGQKPFGCSECGQRFGKNSSLNRHIIIHTGQKPFDCSECGQRFGQKSHLNRHLLIHKGQKPFGCSECSQRFGQKSNLTKHMIIHTRLDTNLECTSTQLDNPPDQRSTDPGPQQHHCQRAKRNKQNYNTVNWSIEEKKKILHCFAYSRYEKWGREKKAVFEDRIKEADLPAEKKEATTTANLQSIVSQIPKYLTAEEIESIKEAAQKEAMNDHQSLEEGKRLQYERSQWKREEEWVLMWAIEYAKLKYTSRRATCREWQRIFHCHCPSKKDLPRGRLTSQRHNFVNQKHFTDEEMQAMQDEISQMVKGSICPLTHPIAPPKNNPPQQKTPGQKPFGCSECGKGFAQKCSLNRHMKIHTGQEQNH